MNIILREEKVDKYRDVKLEGRGPWQEKEQI